MSNRRIRFDYAAWFLAGIVCCFLATRLLERRFESARVASPMEKRIARGTGLRLTNPLLECCEDCRPRTNLGGVKRKVEELIERALDNGEANKVAVYIRDLNNGPWVGVNSKEEFSPASLLKIPTMMVYLKLAEQDRSILEKRLFISEPLETSPQLVPAEETIQVGTEYTVRELIRRMIVYSDNVAKEMLCRAVGEEQIMKIYRDIGVELPQMHDYLTVRDYASFFRILYNASYVSWDLSEWALGLLLETRMNDGIRAGVPVSVKVASKFGEREFNDGLVQLHDCGIVYASNTPYILCVMTRGSDLGKLEKIIAGISRVVYDFVQEHQ